MGEKERERDSYLHVGKWKMWEEEEERKCYARKRIRLRKSEPICQP
jgi:hypothetical protein